MEVPDRMGLLRSLFNTLDANHDGVLDCWEMKRFAEHTGFDGDELAWIRTFEQLCLESKDKHASAVDFDLFTRLINDESQESGVYCTDEELRQLGMDLRSEPSSPEVTEVGPPAYESASSSSESGAPDGSSLALDAAAQGGRYELMRRQDLIGEVFNMLDVDGDGRLSAEEMMPFAEFTGFEGTLQEWEATYRLLCSAPQDRLEEREEKEEVAASAETELAALDLGLFASILNREPEDSTAYCPDDELRAILRLYEQTEADEDKVGETDLSEPAPATISPRPARRRRFTRRASNEAHEGAAASHEPPLAPVPSEVPSPSHSPAAAQRPYPPENVERATLVRAIFDLLDRDKQGCLGEREMLEFAVLTGFNGSSEEWDDAYRVLCSDLSSEESNGGSLTVLSLPQFTRFLDSCSEDRNCFCPDDELLAIMDTLQRRQPRLGLMPTVESSSPSTVGARCSERALQAGHDDAPRVMPERPFEAIQKPPRARTTRQRPPEEPEAEIAAVHELEPMEELEASPGEDHTLLRGADLRLSRGELIYMVFRALDLDCDSLLSKEEMRPFALATGFLGGDVDWSEAYSRLLADSGGADSAVDLAFFTRMVDDNSEETGVYCSLHALEQLLSLWGYPNPSQKATLPLSRAQLIIAVFHACDADRDGRLCSHELRLFADSSGFHGTDTEWVEGYEALCFDCGVVKGEGLSVVILAQLVDDNSSAGWYCSDEELRSILVSYFSLADGDGALPGVCGRRLQVPPPALVRAVFAAFDTDGDGRLNSEDMQEFASSMGFAGDDKEWDNAYSFICAENGRGPEDGIDEPLFADLLDKGKLTSQSDGELISRLTRLRAKLEASSKAALVGEIFRVLEAEGRLHGYLEISQFSVFSYVAGVESRQAFRRICGPHHMRRLTCVSRKAFADFVENERALTAEALRRALVDVSAEIQYLRRTFPEGIRAFLWLGGRDSRGKQPPGRENVLRGELEAPFQTSSSTPWETGAPFSSNPRTTRKSTQGYGKSSPGGVDNLPTKSRGRGRPWGGVDDRSAGTKGSGKSKSARFRGGSPGFGNDSATFWSQSKHMWDDDSRYLQRDDFRKQGTSTPWTPLALKGGGGAGDSPGCFGSRNMQGGFSSLRGTLGSRFPRSKGGRFGGERLEGKGSSPPMAEWSSGLVPSSYGHEWRKSSPSSRAERSKGGGRGGGCYEEPWRKGSRGRGYWPAGIYHTN